jgi:cytidyltransferase-like protein
MTENQASTRRDKSHIKPAPILSFEEFASLRERLEHEEAAGTGRGMGRIVATSGGYDPVHPGHTSSIHESHKYGDTVVVIVNGDNFLTKKKGKPFIDLNTRCHTMSYISGVDYVIPFEIENDQTVCVALEKLKPHVFTKGGDRIDASSIPEWDVCQANGIEIVSGVGFDKNWSSSDFLKKWGEFYKNRR